MRTRGNPKKLYRLNRGNCEKCSETLVTNDGAAAAVAAAFALKFPATENI